MRPTARGADIAVVAGGATDATALAGEVTAALQRAGLANPAVAVEVAPTLERLDLKEAQDRPVRDILSHVLGSSGRRM